MNRIELWNFRIVVGTAICCLALSAQPSMSQDNRIGFNGQDLFLNGANLAWHNFAMDVGPGNTDFDHFRSVFDSVRAHGGNCVRLWLHTNGSSTPAFSGSLVVDPGEGTIEDLERILDLAWERDVGLILCLWSHDMLRISYGTAITDRSLELLTNSVCRQSYIDNALVPMATALRDHPGIIAWEIFNEPEGMSSEFGWDKWLHVPMGYYQAFVNLCAGAIHRADSDALVTSGAWKMSALTDVGTNKYNYYSDARLIASGGDADGTLDFYSVHFYDEFGAGDSPFDHDASTWGLDKPLVVGEFYPESAAPGDPFEILFQGGYAGALVWSWTDRDPSDFLPLIGNTATNHPEATTLIRSGCPAVYLTSPNDGAVFPDEAIVELRATATDPSGSVARVEFYHNDTLITEDSLAPFASEWILPTGTHEVFAVAIDNESNRTASAVATISVLPPVLRYEAEEADSFGGTVIADATASGGSYVSITSGAAPIIWTLHDVPATDTYGLSIRYCLPFGEKDQYLYVNGEYVDTVVFDGAPETWLRKDIAGVQLERGTNTVEVRPCWGYMRFDGMDPSYGVHLFDVEKIPGAGMSFSFNLPAGAPYAVEASTNSIGLG